MFAFHTFACGDLKSVIDFINDSKGLTAEKPAAPETSRCGGVKSASEKDGKEDHDAHPVDCIEVAASATEVDSQEGPDDD